MPSHHLEAAPARFRQSFEPFRGRPEPVRVNRENGQGTILPFNDPGKGRPGGLGDVEKN